MSVVTRPTTTDVVWAYLSPREILHLADGSWSATELKANVFWTGRGAYSADGLNFETVAVGCSWSDGHRTVAVRSGLLTWKQMVAAVRRCATPALVDALADVQAQVIACAPAMYWLPLSAEELADTARAEEGRRASARYYRLQPELRRAAAAIVFAAEQLDLFGGSS